MAIQKLIPVNNLCGRRDTIPGLRDDYFPAPRNQKNNTWSNRKLEAMERMPIYLRNLRMQASVQFETKFKKFLEQLCLEENGVKASDVTGVAKAKLSNI
jgi:hypothetical protein